MAKRLMIIITSVLILTAGFPIAVLASGGDPDGPTDFSSEIWQGLCVGASLDLSKASQVRCARKERAAHQEDNTFVDNQPNIGAGLCVGASLDLSKASQKKCVATTPNPPNAPGACGSHCGSSHSVQTSPTPHQHPRKHRGNTTATTPSPPQSPTTTPISAPVQYAALGDSIAAGLGLSATIDSSDVCGRSLGSYANQVADARGLTVTNFACKGAKMGDLLTEQHIKGPNPPAQLDGAFAGGTPTLITITAGANDVRWQEFLRKCYARTCGTERDQRVANGLLAALDQKTQATLQDIGQRSGGSPPEVILTGYYTPLSDRCAEIEPRLTLEEISWLDEQTAELNQTLENAATASGIATFVSIDFTGHDICSSDPWVQTLDDPAPFHPTLEGQRAIAQAIQ